MIVCRTCSRRHPDGTEFCVCGAYLEFDGEHLAEPGSGAAVPPPPGPPAGSAPAAPPAPAQPPAGAWSARPPAPRQAAPSPSIAAEPAPWSGFEPAREPAHPAGGIDAVLPDAPDRAPTPGPVWVETGGRAGDVACRQCGTANDPGRYFCRHCGMSLTGSVDAATTPPPRKVRWWRRMFGGARSRADSATAASAMNKVHGLARGGMTGRTMLFRSGGVVVVLAGLLAFLGPWRGPVLAKGRELLGAERFSLIDVAAEEVSSAATDAATAPAVFDLQGPGNVVDRFANTGWATRWLDPASAGFEAVPDDADCEPLPSTDTELVFRFAEPHDVSRIRILGGRPADDETRTSFRRPRVVELQFGDAPCRYAELPDDGQLSVIDLGGDDVETVRLRVVGVYEPDAPNETVEISEVVFED